MNRQDSGELSQFYTLPLFSAQDPAQAIKRTIKRNLAYVMIYLDICIT